MGPFIKLSINLCAKYAFLFDSETQSVLFYDVKKLRRQYRNDKEFQSRLPPSYWLYLSFHCLYLSNRIVFVFVLVFAFVQLQGRLPPPMATAAICQAGHFVDACHLVSNGGLLAPQVLK